MRDYAKLIDEFRFYGQGIPYHMKDELLNYIIRGRPVGGFLAAVLEGALFRAAQAADDVNITRLAVYAAFLITHAPADCIGSRKKVDAWLDAGGLEVAADVDTEA